MRPHKGFISLLLLIFALSTAHSLTFSNSISDFVHRLSQITLVDEHFIREFKTLEVLSDVNDENSVLIVAVGDIMFHTPQMIAAYDQTTKTYDFTETFAQVAPYIRSADYALGNFETTTAGQDYAYTGYPAFNAPDATLDAIKSAGFDFLSTANNHSFDRKLHGVYRTLLQMKARSFDHGGTFEAGTDLETRYFIKEIKGIKLGILPLTYGLNGFEKAYDQETLDHTVNLIEPEFIKTQLSLMDQAGVDQSIVFIHWGNEYQLTPNDFQKTLAHDMIDWGADLILGSHPHVIQPSEIVNFEGEDKYIIYSMGNFVSNQSRETLSNIKNSKYTEDGVMVFIKLVKDESGTHLDLVRHVPTWVHKYTDSGQVKYIITPTVERYHDRPFLQESLKASYLQTMDRLIDYSFLKQNHRTH